MYMDSEFNMRTQYEFTSQVMVQFTSLASGGRWGVDGVGCGDGVEVMV